MFELSNYLVGIYKVDDCTDSITLVNHPPPPLPPSSQTQRVGFTQSPDATLVNGEITVRQQEETQVEPQQHMIAEISRLCGRETTFAPNLESTVLSQVVAAATTVAAAAAVTSAESNKPCSPKA